MNIKRIFPSIEFIVSSDEDIYRARSEMTKFAGKIHLTEKELEELRIVITEISKNIIKHSSSGKLNITLGKVFRGVVKCNHCQVNLDLD